MELKHLLLAAGGAAGGAAILWCLLRDDPEWDESLLSGKGGDPSSTGAVAARRAAARPGKLDKAELIKILEEIQGAQDKMKQRMKSISADIVAGEMSFDQLYERVKKDQLEDPCESRGLSSNDLAAAIEMNQADPEIQRAMESMGGGGMPTTITERAKTLNSKTIEEINLHMVQELQRFCNDFQTAPDSSKYDRKLVVACSQVKLDAAVLQKFGVIAEDVEGAIMLNMEELKTSPVIASTQEAMQKAVMGLMYGS